MMETFAFHLNTKGKEAKFARSKVRVSAPEKKSLLCDVTPAGGFTVLNI